MQQPRIIGISLIKNEDLHIEHAVTNALPLCDELIILDNYSTDGTWNVVKKLARANSQIRLERSRNTAMSHTLIEKYAGTHTWVFGVDGDEIYDPGRLALLRRELLAGKYDGYWQIFGNVLNCIELDTRRFQARGYMAPPSRSMTKLYNFYAIDAWQGPCIERFHGGELVFKKDFSQKKRLMLHEKTSWEESVLRCLHVCFLPRSSNENDRVAARENIMEIRSRRPLRRILARVFKRLSSRETSTYKNEKYRRGPLHNIDVSAFCQSRAARQPPNAINSDTYPNL
jgi:glycosyltransferase involved in cell wall biosynthesis